MLMFHLYEFIKVEKKKLIFPWGFGPDVRSLALTMLLTVVPVIMFAVFVSQKLVDEFHHYLKNLIVALAIAFAAYNVFLLVLTSGRDPGIIPRGAHPPEPDDDGSSSILSSDWAGTIVMLHDYHPQKM